MAGQRVIAAVPRGTLMGKSLDLLEGIGYDVAEVRENDRKLFFDKQGIITMRPSDVATYVERGVADIGIVGKDVLMEQSDRDLYEVLDLDFGACRMIVAVVEGNEHASEEQLRRRGTLRVATKYPKIAQKHFGQTGRQVELVEVKGSVELAAIAGMADAIVDLTATGITLRENGLVVTEEIVDCTARLIVNPGAYRLKSEEIDRVVAELSALVSSNSGG
ncbi:MAG: ATP phosphoribosyltransferase [Thermoleophilaceae bacterium]|nr:ATP phosphoribosyltransferase [Thermoleophilaceae bacterium]